MPRKPPPKITNEEVFEQFRELFANEGVDGVMLAAVVDGKRVVLWGANTENAALACMESAGEMMQEAANWVRRGGMRPCPGSQTH